MSKLKKSKTKYYEVSANDCSNPKNFDLLLTEYHNNCFASILALVARM